MRYLSEAGTLLIEVLFFVLCSIIVLRVLLQLMRADFYNPISQFLYKATNPILMPLRRWLPPLGRLDIGGSLIAWLLQMLKVLLLLAVAGRVPGLLGLMIMGFAELLAFVLSLFLWLVVLRVIVSWIGQGGHHPMLPLLAQLTEPLLRPVRRRLPDLGGFDLSPMLVILALLLARILIAAPLLDLGARLA